MLSKTLMRLMRNAMVFLMVAVLVTAVLLMLAMMTSTGCSERIEKVTCREKVSVRSLLSIIKPVQQTRTS